MGFDEVGIVDFDKIGFVFVVKGCACGAVGFVADYQVKISQAGVLLGFAVDCYGMVARKHYAHVLAVVAFAHFFGKLSGVGGGGVAQFMAKGLHDVIVFFALVAYVAVETHGKAVQGRGGFLCQFCVGAALAVWSRLKPLPRYQQSKV